MSTSVSSFPVFTSRQCSGILAFAALYFNHVPFVSIRERGGRHASIVPSGSKLFNVQPLWTRWEFLWTAVDSGLSEGEKSTNTKMKRKRKVPTRAVVFERRRVAGNARGA